jgi:hypothetical protein
MTSPVAGCVVLVAAVAVAVAACGGGPQMPAPLPIAGGTPAAPPAPAPTPVPATHPYTGTYAMTLTIGSSCTVVPEAERTRAYTARFDRVSDGSYVVSLSDALFLHGLICELGGGRFAGIGCHQFFAHDEASQMRFVLANNNDEAHGGHIVEQTASGRWLEIIGETAGARDPAFMDAAGETTVWWCGEARSYPFPCFQSSACQSAELRMTFRRK